MISISGVVGSSGKYLVTGMPIDTSHQAILKIAFGNNTSGTNLGLYVGTVAQFESGIGGTQLSDSGGPGFTFLTIVDANKFSGQVIFVRREVGSVDSTFTLSVE